VKPKADKKDRWLCESIGCLAEVSQSVIVRINPRTVTYAYVCDECAKLCAVQPEDLPEDTDFIFGHNALVHDADISYHSLCVCGHGKEYHRFASCIGRHNDGSSCNCGGFSL
jgi:hypothetical protein